MKHAVATPARFPSEWTAKGTSSADIKWIATLPARLLGVVPVGRVEIGLAGMCFEPVVGSRRCAPLDVDFGALHLPLGLLVPELARTPPRDWTTWRPTASHLTLDMALRIAKSAGFRGHLSERRQADRALVGAHHSGFADEGFRHAGFIALGRERLCFFDDSQSGWAAALGEEVLNLAFMDSRLELLFESMLWLDDDGWHAAVERKAVHERDLRVPEALRETRRDVGSWTRGDVRAAHRLEHRILLGSDDDAVEIPLTPENQQRLAAWLAAL